MEIPQSASNYLKLQEWAVKIRILSQDFVEWFSDRDEASKQSVKYKKDECPENAMNPDWFIYFQACVIWNYDEKMIQIFEIKSKVIMRKLQALVQDEDRGPELDYDLKVTKTGKSKDTKYDLIASGKGPTTKEIMKAYTDLDLQLESLLENIDPFKK